MSSQQQQEEPSEEEISLEQEEEEKPPVQSQPEQQQPTSPVRQVRVDLTEQQKRELTELDNEIQQLENIRNQLIDELNELNTEKRSLEKIAKNRRKSIHELNNEAKCIYRGKRCEHEVKLTSLLTTYYPIETLQIQYNIFNDDISHDDLINDFLNDHQQRQLTRKEFFRYLTIIEKYRDRSEAIPMRPEKCDSILQDCMLYLRDELHLLVSTPTFTTDYSNIDLFKRIITAISSLFRYSTHKSKVWTSIVNNGVLDFILVNVIHSNQSIDLGIVFRCVSLLQEITSCETSREMNLEKAKIFHHWFQTGTGIIALIELLKRSLQFLWEESLSPPASPAYVVPSPITQNLVFDTPASFDSRQPSKSGQFEQQYSIVFSVLCILWNLSRSHTLQLYIQNSIAMDVHRDLLLDFPKLLSESFRKIPQSLKEIFPTSHTIEIQKLLLKICSNVCVDVPEYMVISSQLHIERQAIQLVNNNELFFDSIFTFATFANSPFLSTVEVKALTSILMYNICKPTLDPNKLIRCIKIMSFILNDYKLLNKFFKDTVVNYCHHLMNNNEELANRFIDTLKFVETDEDMKQFGNTIVMNPVNKKMMRRLSRQCIEFLENHHFPLPDAPSVITNDESWKRGVNHSKSVSWSANRIHSYKHHQRTDSTPLLTGRKQSLANWSPSSVQPKSHKNSTSSTKHKHMIRSVHSTKSARRRLTFDT